MARDRAQKLCVKKKRICVLFELINSEDPGKVAQRALVNFRYRMPVKYIGFYNM